MQFKNLEWKDVMSDGVIVCSHCKINLCGWIEITFCVNYENEMERIKKAVDYLVVT